jgi:hypothetical protein
MEYALQFLKSSGIVTEQQQIESYYGLIKRNTKLGRIGALKMDVGYKYLTQEGFQSLLKFDANLISQLEVGRIRQETLDSISCSRVLDSGIANGHIKGHLSSNNGWAR